MAAQKDWVISRDEFETDDEFRGAVVNELASLENIGYRTGGVIIATPIRQRVPDEMRRFEQLAEYETVAWVFQQRFMPAAKRREAPAEPEFEQAPDGTAELAYVAAGDGSEPDGGDT